MQGLWLYVHFNALQLSSVVVDDDQLAWHSDKPIGIYEPLNNQLCQINPAAAALGLKTNMGLAAASALCADLDIIEYDSAQEGKLLKSVAQQLYGVTADISLDKPNGLYLRVDNMLKLYGSLEAYWQVVSNILNTLDCGYHYATAYSISAAKVLAKAAYNHICEDQQKWKQALCQATLQHSDLSEKQLVALQRVGIQSFTDLFKQPVSAIAARFDGDMLRYLSELKGERFSQLPLYRPEQQFEQQFILLYEITLSERLLKPLHSILLKLEHFLVQRGLIAFDLQIELQLRDHETEPTQSWQLHCAQGESRATAWLDIASISIERLKLLAPVQGLTLSTKQLSSAVAANDDLFAGKQHTMNNLHLLARLHAKLGDKAVTQVILGDDHRPEYMNQAIAPGAIANHKKSLAQAHPSPQDRPALILNQPIPLVSDSKILSPPERIVTGWWDEKPVARDYFIAQNTQGQYLWVFRTPGNDWFVHGYFA
jgi:protein ImuB